MTNQQPQWFHHWWAQVTAALVVLAGIVAFVANVATICEWAKIWPCVEPPVPTPSPTPAPLVLITWIDYDPADQGATASERVVIEHGGGAEPVTMTNWTLCDKTAEPDHCYTFPLFTLEPGQTVTVWNAVGTNSEADRYTGHTAQIWNNEGDTAFLRDGDGNLVDDYSYP
jgi:hypothetical protein